MSRNHVRRNSRGQALAEFAIVFPLLMLLFLAVIEFGRFVLTYEALSNAVREGTRWAIVHGANSDCPSGPMPGGGTSPSSCSDPSGAAVKNHVLQYAFTLRLTADQVTVRWGDPNNHFLPNDNSRGNSVTVTADYTFSPIVPLPLPPIGLTGRSTLVINH